MQGSCNSRTVQPTSELAIPRGKARGRLIPASRGCKAGGLPPALPDLAQGKGERVVRAHPCITSNHRDGPAAASPLTKER